MILGFKVVVQDSTPFFAVTLTGRTTLAGHRRSPAGPLLLLLVLRWPLHRTSFLIAGSDFSWGAFNLVDSACIP